MKKNLNEPSMLPEYKKVLDAFGLKYLGDGCYSWNGHWLVSYYGDKDFCMWAVMQGIRKEWIKNDPFISLGGCECMSPEELEERISGIIKKYNQVKEEIKLENLQKDFK
jgi:hypothetical protein